MTGTLASGTLTRGDHVDLLTGDRALSVAIRGLQCCGAPQSTVSPVARVALNLRGAAVDEVHRGAAVVTPDSWHSTGIVDVWRSTGAPLTAAPEQLMVHVGTAAVPARLRCFGDDLARLTLQRRLPLIAGDRLLLRNPGSRRVLGGVLVLDADPPALHRRGDAARRSATLADLDPDDTVGRVRSEVARRGAVTQQRLRILGCDCATVPADVRVLHGWWVHVRAYDAWRDRLQAAVRELRQRDPLAAGLSRGAAVDVLALPDPVLLDDVVRSAGLEQRDGAILAPGARGDLGPAEAAIAALESRLAADPFHAPEADDLAGLQLGTRELAAAERAGRLLRLRDGLVLLPSAPALAMRELSRLDQPFTASQARQALATTRRVMIPLLEFLDARGWTRRIDAVQREVLR